MPRPRLRVCNVQGCPELSEASKCDKHRRDGYREADAQRPSSAGRGYGPRHQALRKQWAPKVAAGSISCSRCGILIAPGQLWDLGHDDVDRSLPTHPEHRLCNRATKSH